MKSYAPLAFSAFALTLACGDRDPLTAPRQEMPAFGISDGNHSAGNPDFFFLPPLVPEPKSNETYRDDAFHGKLAPRVAICELMNDPADPGKKVCVSGPAFRTFASSAIAVSITEEHYRVNWDTKSPAINTEKYYRIQVLLGDFLLGFADVDPVSTGSQLRNVDTDEYIGLVDGRTLPIKFRIEEGATCENDADCAEYRVTASGGTFLTPSKRGALAAPDGWLPDNIAEVTLTLEGIPVGATNDCHSQNLGGGPGFLAEFEGCLKITTEPDLRTGAPNPGVQKTVIVGLCLEEDGKQSPFEPFLRIFKSDVDKPPFALDDAPPPEGLVCDGYTGTNLASAGNPLQYFATLVGDGLGRIFGVRPLYAVDLGEGGQIPPGESFSRFSWGVQATVAPVTATSRTVPTGSVQEFSVLVTGLKFHHLRRSQCPGEEETAEDTGPAGCIAPVSDAEVTFRMFESDLDEIAEVSVLTGANGIATVLLGVGNAPASYTVTASVDGLPPVTFAIDVRHLLLGTDAMGGRLLSINTATGAATPIGLAGVGPRPSLAVDPATGTVYMGRGAGIADIYTLNPLTGAATFVGSTGLGFAAVAALDFGPDGKLYAAVNVAGDGGTGADHLATINTATGVATIIGPFGSCTGVQIPVPRTSPVPGACSLEGMEGIAFGPDGTLWGSLSTRGRSGAPGLYKINVGGETPGMALFFSPIVDALGAAPSGGVVSLDFAADGTLYGGTGRASDTATDGGKLVTIDPQTGVLTYIGTSVESGALAGLSFR